MQTTEFDEIIEQFLSLIGGKSSEGDLLLTVRLTHEIRNENLQVGI
jgi:hypothetical protein